MIFTQIYPPSAPTAENPHGSKNYALMADGNKYRAKPEVGANLAIDVDYQCTVSPPDKWGTQWINAAVLAAGADQAQQFEQPQQPFTPPAPADTPVPMYPMGSPRAPHAEPTPTPAAKSNFPTPEENAVMKGLEAAISSNQATIDTVGHWAKALTDAWRNRAVNPTSNSVPDDHIPF